MPELDAKYGSSYSYYFSNKNRLIVLKEVNGKTFYVGAKKVCLLEIC